MLPKRQCQVLRLIRRHGPISRKEVSNFLELHPNIAGQLVGDMLESGIVREGLSDSLGRGRPRIPLEIDPDSRFMLAATINRDEVSACRINLLGQVSGNTLSKSIHHASCPAEVAAELLERLDSESTLGIGISALGFIDPEDSRTLLLSSVAAKGCSCDLSPLYDVVGGRPLVLENDMHALAAQWVLSHGDESPEHILLVSIRDGTLGAAVLVDGRPNHGGVAGCNELGHVKFFVDTEPCYCGQVGCLERICSSEFLRLHGAPSKTTLTKAVANMNKSPLPQMQKFMDYLGTGLANAVNFIRPDRLVIAGPLVQSHPFSRSLQQEVQENLLSPISDRLRIDFWPLADAQPSVNTLRCLALAPIYLGHWPLHQEDKSGQAQRSSGSKSNALPEIRGAGSRPT